MAEVVKSAGVPRWLKSVGAVVAGFAAVVLLSTGADQVMHETGVFPPPGQRMDDPLLYGLALAYRGVFTVAGGWITARLAPSAPMRHVLVLALIGLAAGTAGAVATWSMDLGPHWYAVAVAVTGPLFTLLGGALSAKGR